MENSNKTGIDPYTEWVLEFHKVFGLPAPPFPTLPDLEVVNRRLNLIKEEALEVEEALKNGRIEDMAKELMDLMYVTAGTLVELGLARYSYGILREVHRSNMSKTASMSQAVQDAVKKEAEGVECDVQPTAREGAYLIVRREDGKIIKPSTYSPANIQAVLYGSK